MPGFGHELTVGEVERLGLDLDFRAGHTAVWGKSRNGVPVARVVRPGLETLLVGEVGYGFDVGGPRASLCAECGVVLFGNDIDDHVESARTHADVHTGDHFVVG